MGTARSEEMVTIFGKDVPKRIKYSWNDLKEPGTFMMISKHDIQIPEDTYQRGEKATRKQFDIAKNFDWKLFGAISVSMRPDGSMYVYAGGHRLRAAKKRDDVDEIPCMVFEIGDIESEAKAFIDESEMRNSIGAYDRYRAGLTAKDPVAIAAKEILDQFGYSFGTHHKPYTTKAIKRMQTMVAQNRRLAERVFGVCVEIAADGEHIPQTVLGGLFELAKRTKGKENVLSVENVDKLSRAGMPTIERAIRDKVAHIGKGGVKTWMAGILDVINKGRRNKIYV